MTLVTIYNYTDCEQYVNLGTDSGIETAYNIPSLNYLSTDLYVKNDDGEDEEFTSLIVESQYQSDCTRTGTTNIDMTQYLPYHQYPYTMILAMRTDQLDYDGNQQSFVLTNNGYAAVDLSQYDDIYGKTVIYKTNSTVTPMASQKGLSPL